MKRSHFFFALLPLAAVFLGGCGHQPAQSTEGASLETEVLEVAGLENRWWHEAIVYEIWPRSFMDADGDGNGDFNGITARLDYLEDLGVEAIWFTPIFEAPSYHGYDFVSFTELEGDYGTMAEFEAMLQEAHDRDIRIILDLVINHISNQHPWFLKSAAGDPRYDDYFIWKDERPEGWGKAWTDEPDPAAVWHWHPEREAYYYAVFGPTQPDVNLANPTVVEEMFAMARFWLEKGVDGFRLDAVRYAVEETRPEGPDQADSPATIAFWTAFAEHVRTIDPEALLVGEAWADMPTVGLYRDEGRGLDSSFEFDFGYAVTNLLSGQSSEAIFGSTGDGSRSTGRESLWENLVQRNEVAPLAYFSPFLTNHDQPRIMHTLGNDPARMRVAASLLLTSPGTTYLYYGEEIGMTQPKVGSHTYMRAIMQWEPTPSAGFNDTAAFWIDDPRWSQYLDDGQPWWSAYWEETRSQPGNTVAEQEKDPDSLLHHYRKLIGAREALPAIATPKQITFFRVDHPAVWLLHFADESGDALVVINLDPHAAAAFTVPESLRGRYFDAYADDARSLGDSMQLAPAGVAILGGR
jgi:glycosidase